MNEMQSRFADSNPEIGGIIHLDHVNFETPDHDMATVFFMNGLGLTRDPFRRADEQNMGVNVGLQQFHLPRRGMQTPPFHGIIGLVVPDIAGIKERFGLLESLGKFTDTPFTWAEQKDTVLVTSPFGYRIRLHASQTITFPRPLGIAYVEVPVPIGTADGISRFYRQILRAPAYVDQINGTAAAIVTVGPHQQLKFIELPLEDFDMHSMHISYHVTNYNELRTTLAEKGSLMGQGQGEVFFFDKIFDIDTGETIFRIQNEVRSVYHPDFMRPLINRWPIVDEPFTDQNTAMKALKNQVGFLPGTR